MPPSIDGLGDYCQQLWRHWPAIARESPRQTPGSERFHFLVTAGARESRDLLKDIDIDQFERTETGLLEALCRADPDTVWLQYVGYGYADDGCPLWLPQALQRWKSKNSRRKLIVMFHETWATGKPWQKVFWQSPRQKKCAGQLLTAADVAVTSNGAWLKDLQSLGAGCQLSIIPLGCTFVLPAGRLKNFKHLSIFGKEHSRLYAIKRHRQLLIRLAESRLVESIVLSGQNTGSGSINGQALLEKSGIKTSICTAYNFPQDNVPDRLLECGLSLMCTESPKLLKSTSFHLAAAAGQVALCLDEGEPGAPLVAFKNYLPYTEKRIDLVTEILRDTGLLSEIADSASRLASREFNWDSIASAWAAILSAD